MHVYNTVHILTFMGDFRVKFHRYGTIGTLWIVNNQQFQHIEVTLQVTL